MIEFVACDNDSVIVTKVKKIIENVMMKNKLDYNVNTFNDYNDEFMNFISNSSKCTIYILDIVTPSRSGIDVARIIRQNDLNSVIIFLTGHEELGQLILRKELLFLSFINKYDNFVERLNKVIVDALRHLNVKRVLRFEEKGTIYTISLDDILYITRDSIDRKSIIKTNKNEFKTYKSLLEIMGMLDDRFCRSHKSCIVNLDRVCKVSKLKKIIEFDNGTSIDLISDKYKNKLIKI